jgi:hypothetical protein
MWKFKVLHLHTESGTALIAATRTEGSSTRTYKVSAPIKTQAEKDAVYDKVWAEYQSELAKEAPSVGLLGDFEEKGKFNLEARE